MHRAVLGAAARATRSSGRRFASSSSARMAVPSASFSAGRYAMAGAAALAAGFYVLDRKAETQQGQSPLMLEERVSALEVEAAVSRNHAFVFIKPHAVTPAVAELLKTRLGEHGISISAEGVLDNETIDKDKLIDKHYGAIASKAVLMAPSELNVPDKGKAAFKSAFGMSWEEANKKGLVFNAASACTKLHVDGEGLDSKWSNLKRDKDLIKFGGGFYCGKVDGIFVINGFYMAMRSKYTQPGAAVHYFLVDWDPRLLSWDEFRNKVLGATDPGTAAKSSLRREVYDNWKRLGLPAQPDVGDNGVHASASPFEALAERCNWTGATIPRDPFGRGMLATGIPLKTIQAWFSDPQVSFEGKQQSLFDLLEDMNSGECISRATLIINGHK